MRSEIQKIKDDQITYNKQVSFNDKNNIAVIFQYITMSGLVAIIGGILTFLYYDVNNSLKFNNPIPLLVTEKSFYTPEVKSIFIKQTFYDLYSARNDYEIGLFNLFNSVSLNQNDLLIKFKNFQQSKSDVFDFEIIEVFNDYGTSFVDKKTGVIKNTKSKYTVVIKEEFFAPGTKVTSDFRFAAYELSLDKFGKILDFTSSKNKNITIKHEFVQFLNDITPASISSNIDFNSPISSLALNNMNIQHLEFHRLEMKTKHNGDPIGSSQLFIDGREYLAEINIASDGKPSLLISLK